MRKILLIISVAIPFATVSLIAWYLYSFYKSIVVDYNITNISFKNILKNQLDLTLGVLVRNNSDMTLKAKDLVIVVMYKGKEIAQVPAQDLVVEKNNDNKMFLPLVVKINEHSGEILSLYQKSLPIDLDIKIKAKMYKIPVNYTTQYTYLKS